MQEHEEIVREFETLLEGAGLALVEFSLTTRRGAANARAIVYSPKGTGTAECAKAHRLIYPRLQVLLGIEDPDLEVSSPGIDRTLRSAREYALFVGKGLRIMLVNESEWILGKLVSASEKEISLVTDKGTEVFDLAAVAKARLDSTQEGD
jgi:ribosome maturation factor RimP